MINEFAPFGLFKPLFDLPQKPLVMADHAFHRLYHESLASPALLCSQQPKLFLQLGIQRYFHIR